MRVACPSCGAIYEIPDPVLGSGARTLRCGRCGTEWSLAASPSKSTPERMAAPREPEPEPVQAKPEPRPVEPTEPAAEAENVHAAEAPRALTAIPPIGGRERPPEWPLGPPAPPVAGPSRTGPEPQRRQGTALAWLGWLASVAVIGLLLWAGYQYREGVMHAWPPSQRLYTLLGLGPAPPKP